MAGFDDELYAFDETNVQTERNAGTYTNTATPPDDYLTPPDYPPGSSWPPIDDQGDTDWNLVEDAGNDRGAHAAASAWHEYYDLYDEDEGALAAYRAGYDQGAEDANDGDSYDDDVPAPPGAPYTNTSTSVQANPVSFENGWNNSGAYEAGYADGWDEYQDYGTYPPDEYYYWPEPNLPNGVYEGLTVYADIAEPYKYVPGGYSYLLDGDYTTGISAPFHAVYDSNADSYRSVQSLTLIDSFVVGDLTYRRYKLADGVSYDARLTEYESADLFLPELPAVESYPSAPWNNKSYARGSLSDTDKHSNIVDGFMRCRYLLMHASYGGADIQEEPHGGLFDPGT
jgi:hypothetical protein